MIKKIKTFIIPCVLTMLWIFLLLEVCKFLAPLDCIQTLFNHNGFFYYDADGTSRTKMKFVLSLIFYISLALSVPFVFSTICKKYSVDDKSETNYLLLAIFSLIFCRLSWITMSSTPSGSLSRIYSVSIHSSFARSVKDLVIIITDDLLTVMVFFLILIVIVALVVCLFKLIIKNKQHSLKATILKYTIIAVLFFAITYIVVPYMGYLRSRSKPTESFLFTLYNLNPLSRYVIRFNIIDCLISIKTYPSVILVLVTLACYYVIVKKVKNNLVNKTITSISASMTVASIVLFIYCLLTAICRCFANSENNTLSYLKTWLPGTLLMLLSSFVPLAFLTVFNIESKENKDKVFKYIMYSIVALVYYGSIITISLKRHPAFGTVSTIFDLIGVEPLNLLFIIIPFALLVLCIVSEKQGKPFTEKVYTLLIKILKPLEKTEQNTAVKPDKLKDIKQRAIKQLGGKIFASAWLMLLLALIIHSFITGAVAFTLIGALLVGGPMQYGLTKIQMKLVKEKEYNVDLSDLFKGFSENFTQSIVLGFLQSLFIALWSMLFVIPGIIKSYSYSMAFYIQTQSSDKSWKHSLNESKQLMHGNKLKLLLLDLSFIGWYIVGSMCLGIGIIFVLPYHNQARANFYASIMQKDLKTASATENVEVTESMGTVEIEDNSATA